MDPRITQIVPVYELDHRKPVLYVIPVEKILGKLPHVPVGDTGTIQHHLRNLVGNGVVP